MYNVLRNGEIVFSGKRNDAIEQYLQFERKATLIFADVYKCSINGETVRVWDSGWRNARRPLISCWKDKPITPDEIEYNLFWHLQKRPEPGRKLTIFKISFYTILWDGSGDYTASDVYGIVVPAWYNPVSLPSYTIDASSRRSLVSFFADDVSECAVRCEFTMPVSSPYPPARENDIRAYARGLWQQELISGNLIKFPALRGTANYYWGNYWRSCQNLLQRLRDAGFDVIPVHGPRGGRAQEWHVFDAR